MPRSDDHSTGDSRQPYSEQGGPEGRHAQTHDVRREEATRAQPHEQGPDEFADDLTSERTLAGHDTVSAAADKQVRAELPEFDGDDLKRLSILRTGTPLDQGSVYVDLNDLEGGPFKAIGAQEASDETRYVAKRDTDYEMWGRLVGQGREAVVQRPGEQD